MRKKTFKAIIQPHSSGGAYVDVPFDVEEVFGKKRVKIRATFDGVLYRGLLTKMGTPHHFLLVRKDIQAKIGKGPGDEVKVTVEEDLEPRVVKVPSDVKRLLKQHPEAGKFFEGLSYTHKKEYIQWIEEAKKPETRERRKEKMIEMLLDGRKERS